MLCLHHAWMKPWVQFPALRRVDVVAHTYSPSTQEVKLSSAISLRPAWVRSDPISRKQAEELER